MLAAVERTPEELAGVAMQGPIAIIALVTALVGHIAARHDTITHRTARVQELETSGATPL